jgi:uncharacterized membrane protein YraQ (UPF0718 family)/copper chaperone CopZ
VERHLGGRGLWPVIKAAAFGVPLPLCSCGVIPVAASLRRHGASRGATTAFLISTPQTGVDSIFVTYSLLGWLFAIYRPIAALISGILGGAAVVAFDRRDAKPAPPDACRDECCAEGNAGNKVVRALRYGFLTLPRDIGRSLLVGLVLAALISALLPDARDFAPVLGGGVLAIVILMLAGIPVYVCATASVPIAMALLAKGVSAGAVFAFLVTGPATNAATILTVWRVLGMRTTILYLLTIAGSALAGGLILDYLFRVHGGWAEPTSHEMLPAAVGWGSAVVLLAVLGYAAIHRKPRPKEAGAPEEARWRIATLKISGMTCSHCERTVREALEDLPGIESVRVDLEKGAARVAGEVLDAALLRRTVEELGYKVTDVHEEAAAQP